MLTIMRCTGSGYEEGKFLPIMQKDGRVWIRSKAASFLKELSAGLWLSGQDQADPRGGGKEFGQWCPCGLFWDYTDPSCLYHFSYVSPPPASKTYMGQISRRLFCYFKTKIPPPHFGPKEYSVRVVGVFPCFNNSCLTTGSPI